MQEIKETLSEIPYIDKLMEINGIGIKTVSCFIAEVGDIGRFDNPKQVQKLAGYAIVAEQLPGNITGRAGSATGEESV